MSGDFECSASEDQITNHGKRLLGPRKVGLLPVGPREVFYFPPTTHRRSMEASPDLLYLTLVYAKYGQIKHESWKEYLSIRTKAQCDLLPFKNIESLHPKPTKRRYQTKTEAKRLSGATQGNGRRDCK
ncbi:hypothetical protein CEXT_543931 [Caerostris extrusa]|uniref:Uncharacterized protein n=1 Tax=Caerostris extrusa TaxID=172846 RepID=A0AAV4T0M6_CAEEX|nr:hypothetical protein CEXT_543931 [Caerostris extrusa]